MSDAIKVQYSKGNDSQQEEFIDFINYVFHMNGKDNDFYRTLPKIYKREYHPCEYNYFTLEDNHIKAAVGAFPGEVTICGTTLRYTGIGNVAVNPYSRSKGYMKKLMNLAVDQILQEDVDFSMLCGRRNRYSYFSYEVCGRKNCLWMDESNVKHSFPKDRKERFHFVKVSESDTENLQKINDLQITQPLHYKRERNKLFEILKNWNTVDIYCIFEETRFAGYLLFYDKANVKEILLHEHEDISEVVADFINSVKKDGINIELAEYQRYFINSLSVFSENVSNQAIGNFSIFNYGKVIEALLRLKAQTDKLADGKVTLYIHGKKMDEKLLITVKDNQVSIINTEEDADYEFSHLEAMSILFQNYSSLRNRMPFEIQTWLPLPIHIFPADEV